MTGGSRDKLALVMDTAMSNAAKLNEEFVKKGAFTLSYSTDASLYWAGLAHHRRADRPEGAPVFEAMEEALRRTTRRKSSSRTIMAPSRRAGLSGSSWWIPKMASRSCSSTRGRGRRPRTIGRSDCRSRMSLSASSGIVPTAISGRR